MTFDELVGDAALWEALAADTDQFATEVEADLVDGVPKNLSPSMKWKPFLIRRNRERAHAAREAGVSWRVAPEDPWLRLGAASRLLHVVNAYRGLRMKLVEFDQWYTIPVGTEAARSRSQNWHRDPEDLNVVKAFLYFSDVDAEAAPFEYVRGSQPGGPLGNVWPWTFSNPNVYPSPAEFAERIPRDRCLTVTGRSGTLILCNSSGLHRGGLARTAPRMLSLHVYVSPASLAVGACRRRFQLVGPQTVPGVPAGRRFALS